MAGFFCSVSVHIALLLLLTSCALGNKKHASSVTGDPTLSTFSGRRVSVAIPCMYRVAKIKFPNRIQSSSFPYRYTEVEVMASNGNNPINGHYYISNVGIKVSFLTDMTKGAGKAPGLFGTFTTGYDQMEAVGLVKNTGQKETKSQKGNEVWQAMPDGYLRGRVDLRYNVSDNCAELRLWGTSFQIRFCPVNRSEGPGRQSRRPGLWFEFGNDGRVASPEVFPNTLSSTLDDDKPLGDHVPKRLSRSAFGIYPVLEQAMDQSLSDDEGSCTDAVREYGACYDKVAAVNDCDHFLTNRRVVKCVHEETSYTAIQAFSFCLRHFCHPNDLSVCNALRDIAAVCERVSGIIKPTCLA